MGLLLVVAIVSGVVLYAPFMRKLDFGTVREEHIMIPMRDGVKLATDIYLPARAGQSGACTFTVAGAFAYSDPNKKGNTYRGTVTVTAPPGVAAAITLAASRPLVVYGTKVALTGKAAIRELWEPTAFFEALGVRYAGPFDGHDIATTVAVQLRTVQLAHAAWAAWQQRDSPGRHRLEQSAR